MSVPIRTQTNAAQLASAALFSDGTLATEASYVLAIDFIPTTAGQITGAAILIDDAPNIAATQIIALLLPRSLDADRTQGSTSTPSFAPAAFRNQVATPWPKPREPKWTPIHTRSCSSVKRST